MFPSKDALANAIYDQVVTAEKKSRRVNFVPRQAVKQPIRAAVSALAAKGECVLADGTKIIAPQVSDAFSNAIGFGPKV